MPLVSWTSASTCLRRSCFAVLLLATDLVLALCWCRCCLFCCCRTSNFYAPGYEAAIFCGYKPTGTAAGTGFAAQCAGVPQPLTVVNDGQTPPSPPPPSAAAATPSPPPPSPTRPPQGGASASPPPPSPPPPSPPPPPTLQCNVPITSTGYTPGNVYNSGTVSAQFAAPGSGAESITCVAVYRQVGTSLDTFKAALPTYTGEGRGFLLELVGGC